MTQLSAQIYNSSISEHQKMFKLIKPTTCYTLVSEGGVT